MVLQPGEVMVILLPRFYARSSGAAGPAACPSTNRPPAFRKIESIFAQRKREKTHECHLLSFVFSWLMLEFLLLTCMSKNLSKIQVILVFHHGHLLSLCLHCWSSSVALISVLWEAAFPWVSFHPLQDYLHTFKKTKGRKPSLTLWGICRKLVSPP